MNPIQIIINILNAFVTTYRILERTVSNLWNRITIFEKVSLIVFISEFLISRITHALLNSNHLINIFFDYTLFALGAVLFLAFIIRAYTAVYNNDHPHLAIHAMMAAGPLGGMDALPALGAAPIPAVAPVVPPPALAAEDEPDSPTPSEAGSEGIGGGDSTDEENNNAVDGTNLAG